MVSMGPYILTKKENFGSQQENDKNLDGRKTRQIVANRQKRQRKLLFSVHSLSLFCLLYPSQSLLWANIT